MVDFGRAEIKENAKAQFKNQYWPLVGYTVLIMLIAGAAGTGCGLGLIPFIGRLLTIAISICFTGPFSVACGWMYYRAYNGESVEISDMFATFKDAETWKRAVATSFFVGLYTFLWSLLFIVPGIVKAYSYRMAAYLIMDDPTITPSEAIKKSMEMTNGYKGEMFVLDLSFIGWFLLSSLTLGLLNIFWTLPYLSLAQSGVYGRLRGNAASAPVNAEAYTDTYTDNGTEI